MHADLPSEVAGSSELATLTRRSDGYTEKGCAAEEQRRTTGGGQHALCLGRRRARAMLAVHRNPPPLTARLMRESCIRLANRTRIRTRSARQASTMRLSDLR